MENAVKALLIAAGVLIGMMVLSLGVSLYTSLSQYVDTLQTDISSTAEKEFNERFVKYINYDGTEKKFTLRIQDIVTAANAAYENNLEYELTAQDGSNYYVTIKVDGRPIEDDIKTDAVELLSDGTKNENEYKCTVNDVKINSTTGRVCEVNFTKI